ncbi:hypothetical protein [Pseudomonas sp. BN417]|uniref:hypothetical protein n=1 Tax=Pseudomonas sp. BN417 TaxID=2567890 RepID=UPI0024576732|nr:hypothetical protein [Pseudomonas sp. BN417]
MGFDAGCLKIKVTPQLATVLASCRDDVLSPCLIHRRPERKKKRDGKIHWTQADERLLTRAFKDARDEAGCCRSWKEEEMQAFRDPRPLPTPHKRTGKDGQKICRTYQRRYGALLPERPGRTAFAMTHLALALGPRGFQRPR